MRLSVGPELTFPLLRLAELFAASPDLLFHITTMLSPRVLREAGVPCYKIIQKAGEYVITFPKAYHGGFSLGFNCAEVRTARFANSHFALVFAFDTAVDRM